MKSRMPQEMSESLCFAIVSSESLSTLECPAILLDFRCRNDTRIREKGKSWSGAKFSIKKK